MSAKRMEPPHEAEEEPLTQLIVVSQHILEQAIVFVEGLATDEELTAQSRFLPGSTIGKHLRHARDHYTLLLDCMSTPEPRILNYDVRSRNTPMESSREAASAGLRETAGRVAEVRGEMEERLTLHAVTPYTQVLSTTFGRELWFCELHAIHHWSMIRVIAGELGIEVADASFGFAPSTLLSRASDAFKAKY